MSQKMKKLLYRCPWCGRDYRTFVVSQARPKMFRACACGMNMYFVCEEGDERAVRGKGHRAKA